MFMVTQKLHRRRDRGAAAVEFALVVPLLMTILFGMIEFGNLFFVQAQMSGAVRVAVRSVALTGTKAAESSATAQMQGVQFTKDVRPVFTYTDSSGTAVTGCGAGSQATLTVNFKYQSITGLFDWLWPGSIAPMTVKGSMACGG